jgi:enoyl-CoA hydratase/carnithine racemase
MTYKDVPGYDAAIPYRTFAEYAPRFANNFFLEKSDNGVLTAKWHTKGKEMLWGQGPHKGIGQLCADVHQDPDIDVLILGGHGHNYVADFHVPDASRGPLQPEERYDLEYYDGCRSIEALVGLEQSTIGVINGPGYHTEYAIFCDITLIADNAIISEPHYFLGGVPGDGVQIAWREAMGIKRYNYALLTNEIITPQKAVEYGLANEVVPANQIYDRAKELAQTILAAPRVTRMVTTQVLRAPWRKAIAWELRHAFGSEMFAATCTGVEHKQTGDWKGYLKDLGAKMER